MNHTYRRLLGTALLAMISTAAIAASANATLANGHAPTPVERDMVHDITMYAGQVKLLHIGNVSRVALGNGKLLSVKRVGHQLILIGQAVGDTNMLLWNRDGTVDAYNISVTATNAEQASLNLRNALGTIKGLQVSASGGRVVLTGDVTTEDAQRIDKVVQSVPGVVNLTHPQSVDMQRMVYLDVQVVDFKKSALRNIGIDWQNLMAGPVIGIVKDWRSNGQYRIGDLKQGGNQSNQFQGPDGTLTALPLHVPYSEYLGITTSLSSVINLAAQNGDAYILANPQLSTRSGGTASFLAGGEVPIPLSSVLGQTSVQYKPYGVRLKIDPKADAHGNIMATIDTEVSQIDPSVKIDGFPGFLTRKTSSVVNVKDGQTIVLSGLIQSTGAKSIDKFPWLGDIPVLGALFRNKNFQADRSELVIFVTPKIFTPSSPVNRKAVERGTQMVDEFNKNYGEGLYMPGFGVGPTSHQTEKPKDTGSDHPVVTGSNASAQSDNLSSAGNAGLTENTTEPDSAPISSENPGQSDSSDARSGQDDSSDGHASAQGTQEKSPQDTQADQH